MSPISPPRHHALSSASTLLTLLTTTILHIPSSTAQQIGNLTPEIHPLLPTQLCTSTGGCKTLKTSIVADALNGARPFHLASDPSISCSNPQALINTTGTPSLCPESESESDPSTCLAQNCVLEGLDYGSIGVATRGSALTLRQYLFNGEQYEAVSPRVYLLGEDGVNYAGLRLLNQELSFDVDVSRLGCGMNGALYLSEMSVDGGRSASEGVNPAGAEYGTGYCDAQCFTNVPWINGLVGSPSCY
jgi:cellulase